MPQDLEKAIEILNTTDATCVICRGDVVYSSTQRGVSPLLSWLDAGVDMMGFSCADRVVGKGAAMLYSLLGVRRVYGKVMSVAAVKALRNAGIEASWGLLAEGIRNRAKNGPCPIEHACLACEDPEEALPVIRQVLEDLQR